MDLAQEDIHDPEVPAHTHEKTIDDLHVIDVDVFCVYFLKCTFIIIIIFLLLVMFSFRCLKIQNLTNKNLFQFLFFVCVLKYKYYFFINKPFY